MQLRTVQEYCGEVPLAFSKVYSRTKNPNPQSVYEEIEESIREQHGKRTSTSIKYTKHGENARAALESLRQLLMMPQFAYGEGVDFGDFVAKGYSTFPR